MDSAKLLFDLMRRNYNSYLQVPTCSYMLYIQYTYIVCTYNKQRVHECYCRRGLGAVWIFNVILAAFMYLKTGSYAK